MEIVKAKKTDIDEIEKIYENIHDEEEAGRATIGWIRGVYPTRKTAEDALDRGDLFVLKDEGQTVAAAIINRIQVEEYKYAAWKHEAKAEEIMVLHSLVVDPQVKSKGYGKRFVSFYQAYAKQHGCKAFSYIAFSRRDQAVTPRFLPNIFPGIPAAHAECR